MKKSLIATLLACMFLLATASTSEASIWKSIKRGFWNVLKNGVGVKVDDKGVHPAFGKPPGIK